MLYKHALVLYYILYNELKSPISELINKLIKSGIFPDLDKLAEVVSIYKSKNKEEILIILLQISPKE